MDILDNCIPDFIKPSAVLYSVLVCQSLPNIESISKYDKLVVLHSDTKNIDGYNKMLSFMTKNKPVHIFYKNNIQASDTTFVIQGLDHDNTLKVILYSLPYGDISMGIWEGNELEKAQALLEEKKYYNYCNVFFQMISTLKGLQKVKTQYAIKVRSDEYFINYIPFISNMKQLEAFQIMTANIYFRKIFHYPYHISDHIFGGTTKNLITMFAESLRNIEEYKFSQYPKITPEQYLTISYIEHYKPAQSITPPLNHNQLNFIYSDMCYFFQIFPINMFEEFTTRHYGETLTKKMDNGYLQQIGFIEVNSIGDIGRA